MSPADIDMGAYEKFFSKIKSVGSAVSYGLEIASVLGMLPIYFTLKPAFVLAGIPIYNADDFDHASSDEVLKYRSIGGVFMAHQEGGTKSLKITGVLVGPARFLFLKILQTLQRISLSSQRSSGKLKELKDEGDIKNLAKYFQEQNIGWNESEKDDYGVNYDVYEYHKTFPVLTPHKIYTKMYIETIEYIQSVDLGKRVIKYTIALRRYMTPTSVVYDSTGKNFMIGQEKRDKNMMKWIYRSMNFFFLMANILNEFKYRNSDIDLELRYMPNIYDVVLGFQASIGGLPSPTTLFSSALTSDMGTGV